MWFINGEYAYEEKIYLIITFNEKDQGQWNIHHNTTKIPQPDCIYNENNFG